MFSGRRAFRGDSSVETMNAILKEEPPELAGTGRNVPPGVDRIVRHALEKNPAMRFQTARDLAFDLESLSETSVPAVAAVPQAQRIWRYVFRPRARLARCRDAAYIAGRAARLPPFLRSAVS